MYNWGMNLPENLILNQYEIGPLNNFLYILGDEETKQGVIIDPAWDVPFLCDESKKLGLTIKEIWLTHGHPDHVNGLDEILDVYDVPVFISKSEASFYKPKHKNIVENDDHSKFKIGNLEFETILMPGHTPGSQCFLHRNILITGDVIFIDGCGRCDLPGGDARQQYHSLHDILAKLPDDTLLFTGHNYGPLPYATIAQQKVTNPYLAVDSKDDFLRYRMGIM